MPPHQTYSDGTAPSKLGMEGDQLTKTQKRLLQSAQYLYLWTVLQNSDPSFTFRNASDLTQQYWKDLWSNKLPSLKEAYPIHFEIDPAAFATAGRGRLLHNIDFSLKWKSMDNTDRLRAMLSKWKQWFLPETEEK